MNVLVFDIETVPDVEAGRRLYGLSGLNDNDVAKVMFQKRLEQSGGESDFLRHYLHRIVAIAAVLRHGDTLRVWSLGEMDAGEDELIQRFFDGIDKFSPTLVSWNGGGFDLPVLHYRALIHGVPAPRYWEIGDSDRDFRYNNYLNRFHTRQTIMNHALKRQNVIGIDIGIFPLVHRHGGMGIGGHVSVAWKMFAGSGHAGMAHAHHIGMRQFGHHLRIMMKCTVADHLTDTAVDIQYRRKTEINAAGTQLRGHQRIDPEVFKLRMNVDLLLGNSQYHTALMSYSRCHLISS